ncbi:MAG: DNA repair protein RecN [Clostridia bacterium]|nr:DNA repair protein RecN [Clostridia bacterium]
MLQSLHIENIAVIKSVDIDFSEGLCVLTGETGAGKSLLIDSVVCLTGGRVSRDLIRAGEDRALVSALFSPPEGELAAALSELGIDLPEGDSLLLQRVLTRDGRSTARINGRAVTQSILREAGELLINIHGQSDNQKLMQASAHRALLDDYAQDGDELALYRELYGEWKAVRDEMASLRRDVAERIRLREMLEFQIKDIDAAKLKAGEEEKLTERRDKLLHLEKINRQVNLACRALRDGEKATVMSLCDRAEGALTAIAGIIPECDELIERIGAIRAEAEDIAERVREFADEDVGDPTAELDKLEGRLDTISRLGRKYGVGVEAILQFREEAAARLMAIDTADERIEELEQEEAGLRQRLADRADELTAIRKTAAKALSRAVQEALAFLDMPKVRFEVAVKLAAEFGAFGRDEVEFLLSANPGEPVGPMVRIASGGELSRIMLAIRSVLNERYGVPTAIYDEVDTGISGRTARKVGIKLATIAQGTRNVLGERTAGTQVICVTHSAQIASLADAHYVIEKKEVVEGGETRAETTVRFIDEADRVEEIARILGGLDITDAQRAAARELIGEKDRL